MKVYFVPTGAAIPRRGGVAQHIRQLLKQIESDKDVELVPDAKYADVYHVESAWMLPTHVLTQLPKKPVVYVCHGGFVPQPVPVVMHNLALADMIISVAGWMIPRFMAKYANKTIIIPNGIDTKQLEEYPLLVMSDEVQSGYILYAKEWHYHTEDLYMFARLCPQVTFLTTVPAKGVGAPNVLYIGLQSHSNIINLLRSAGALLLTGSEVCPTMLLEAWAVGCPVLAKGVDGSAELMRRGGVVTGGVLYDIPNIAAVESVLANKDKHGAAGKELAKQYEWADIWKQYKAAYYKVCDK